jgi:hypothetical protein
MYALICFDRPDSAPLRDKHRAAHQEFLQKNSSRIVFGGPLKNVADGPSTGALIVVDCATREEAEAFIGGSLPSRRRLRKRGGARFQAGVSAEMKRSILRLIPRLAPKRSSRASKARSSRIPS